ncbi:hypothetical protein PBT90_11475 [Algoriphagus halophytocola]|uniref:hypothetical protein n=1 Tax=Algoriphagus halophytocola TaxID=2991499 RepID=UPI0022DE972A|nr:hypothetical protein [Algoriphagus sp. TR-M9]WBL41375.1 hypothetical protein PBT90_11475 [Algoriphagus sp. TR-M9]
MGYIPLFVMLGGACVLFYLTVKNSLQRKLNLQKELLFKLNSLNPELGFVVQDQADPDSLVQALKQRPLKESVAKKALKIIREMKLNRNQYNTLLRKAPYNWVGKIAGFQSI